MFYPTAGFYQPAAAVLFWMEGKGCLLSPYFLASGWGLMPIFIWKIALMSSRLLVFSFIFIVFARCGDSSENQPRSAGADKNGKDTSWELGPFIKADSVNPILTPDSTLRFTCPILNRMVKWSEKYVFNPAAVVPAPP